MNRTITGFLFAGSLAFATSGVAQVQGAGGSGFQGSGRFGRFQRGQQGFGGQFGGGRMGFGVGPMSGQNDHNPLVTHVYDLVQRSDVQSEINMDLRQKNALAQYQTQVPTMIRQQMQQQMQSLRGAFGRGQRGGQNSGDTAAPPQDAGADPQQMREQIQQRIQQSQAEIQAKVSQGLAEILRPEQLGRLHQLDLQWRGTLSMADPEVAKEGGVSQEHRTTVNALLTEYQSRVREARQQMFEAMRADRQNAVANSNGTAASGIRQDPFIALERKDTAARDELNEKALKVLAAEERQGWKNATGKTFVFRTDLKTSR